MGKSPIKNASKDYSYKGSAKRLEKSKTVKKLLDC